MRQSDGTDLLGPGNPHSSEVGIIHVEPTDSRQEILKAINTQEITGRKQIAIVLLSDQHKAFRQPVDFDGLKNLRRGLKAQLVFIAQPGPGPANFARQRNFPVFSSLDSFKQALLSEGIQAPGGTRVKSKPGLLNFGRKGQTRNAGQSPVEPLPAPRSQISKHQGQPGQGVPLSPLADLPTTELDQPDQSAARGAAGAAGLVAGSRVMQGLESDDDALYAPPSPQQPGGGAVAPSPNVQTPPTSEATGNATQAAEQLPKAQPEGRPGAGPGIIAFPGVPATPRTTGKMSKMQNVQNAQPKTSAKMPTVQGAQSTQSPGSGKLSPKGSGKLSPTQEQNPQAVPPSKNPPNGSGNTGKVAAVAAGAALGAGTLAGSTATPGTSGTATRAHPAGPPPASAGGTGGTGIGNRPSGLTPLPPPRSQSRRRRFRRRTLLLLLLLLLLSAVFGGSIYLSAHGGPGQIFNPTVTASITITPANKLEQDRYVIVGQTTGTPDPAKNQVAAQTLTKESTTQSATGNATGSIEAKRATGFLTFSNGSTADITLGPTTLSGTSGVDIRFDTTVTVPAFSSPVTVAAHAVNAGANGNIPAGDIRRPCCQPNISVTNKSPFTGGQDAVPNSIITQGDIDKAAKPLITSLGSTTQGDLQKQVQNNQKVVDGSFHCDPKITHDHNAGDQAKTVKVTVSVTCSEEVYDLQAARQIGSTRLAEKAKNDLPDNGSQYALVGQIVPEVLSATQVGANKQVSIYLQVSGLWVYQFTDQARQNLKQMLVKHTKQEAQNILLHFIGIATSPPPVITLSSGDLLPSNADDITITISTLQGAQATVTPAGSQGTPIIGSPTSATPTPTPVLGK